MQRILLLAFLMPAVSLCSAQILVPINPKAISYWFFVGQPPRAIISPLTPEEQARFKQVYDQTLQSDSKLDAEGDALSSRLNTYRAKLTAAMAKADPAVTSALGVASGVALSDAQSDQIRQAQSDAFQADPNLRSEWDDLTKKMTAHQQKVDAAMLKIDPTLATVFAKLSP